MMERVRKMMMCVVILAMVGVASAAYVETWDAFSDGDSLVFEPGSVNGWGVKSSAPSTAPKIGDNATTLGDAAFFALSGNTLRTMNGNDYEIRHTTAGVDFGMTEAAITAAGGITTGFNFYSTYLPGGSTYRVMMILRGTSGNSPTFGFEYDSTASTTKWALRKTDNTQVFGNTVDLSKGLLTPDGIRESWLKITLDYDGQFASLFVTREYDHGFGTTIDTGLTNIDVGAMTAADMAALNRFQVRTGGSSKTYLDNLSVDVIPEPATLALLSLGGLLLRRKK